MKTSESLPTKYDFMCKRNVHGGCDLENHCAVETSVRPVRSGPANQTAVMSVTAVSMKYADISAPSSPLLNISIQPSKQVQGLFLPL